MKKRLCVDEVTGDGCFEDVEVWNKPVLGAGMYPVNWNGSYWEKTTVDKWDYDYKSVAETKSNGTGKWAIALTEDGSIYVWIPRYTYKIVSGYHKAVKSWNSDLVDGTEQELGKIEFKFSDGVKDNTSDGFILHPAFWFEAEEVTGVWCPVNL